MAPIIPRRLPNKLVLVTDGAQPTQLQIIKQLLEGGARVRTTATCKESARWLDNLFSRFTRLGAFECIEMSPQYPSHPLIYREAVKDVHAIAHAATLPGLDRPAREAWDLTDRAIISVLEAAAHGASSVEAFVYTSSLSATVPFASQADTLVTEDACNTQDLMLQTAGRGNADTLRNSCLVRAEQTLRQWVRETKPRFRVNVVSPSNVIGQNFAPAHTTAWMNWVWEMYYNGGCAPLEIAGAGPTQAHWYVDVEDVALLHIACIFDERISNERLQAWGCYQDRNDVIDIMRSHKIMKARRALGQEFDFEKASAEVAQLYPIIADDEAPCGQLYTSSAKALGIFADHRWKGFGRWKEFEQTIRESLACFDANWGRRKGSSQVETVDIPSRKIQIDDIQTDEIPANGTRTDGGRPALVY
ncbi:hypothetical protein B0I37DRAFT_422347 [Chaetomium sp. MPI-CAGE-AT-0009]|nr:hypothetical protein B0I37DRAFT_422347 [Chaetomium sp. MPI-CAGE-AT-0009]